MRRLFPYPILMIFLVLMWLALTGFSLAQLLAGSLVALLAAQAMAALHPSRPRIRRWDLVLVLLANVAIDIARSNIAVASIILRGNPRQRRSGFLTVPLELRDPTGLATLAIIITSTPGTAWVDYNSTRGTLLLHVFDLVDEEAWLNLIKTRYEYFLLEIFQ